MISDYGRFDLNTGNLVNMADGGETNKGKSGPWLGKKLSEEHKEKLRLAKIGKRGYKHSEETKRKMSEKHTGKILSDNTKKKLSTINTGKKLSEDTKRKIGIASIGRNVKKK
jgi:hypothetical protein